jgi:glycerophosphoryl diester phosphodiesterase
MSVTSIGRPLLFAHRGASHTLPENTLAAFRLAEEEGADGVELDVMPCGSGEVVVFHDDDLERLGGRSERVRDVPLSLLRAVDLGAGERIPLLSEVLERLGPQTLINIELKSAPDPLLRLRDDGLSAKVAELMRTCDVVQRAIVSSFDPLLLFRFKCMLPEAAIGLLFSAGQSRPLRSAWAEGLLAPAALHPESLLVDRDRVRKWQARGRRVHVWTVDAPAEVRYLAGLGVDGIITNCPAEARRTLDEWMCDVGSAFQR